MDNVDNLQLRHIDTLLNLAVLIEDVKSNSKFGEKCPKIRAKKG